MFLCSSLSYGGNNAHSSIRRKRTRKNPCTLISGPVYNAKYGFDLRLAPHRGLEFGADHQPCNHTVWFDAGRLSRKRCQERNLDDKDEILKKKKRSNLKRSSSRCIQGHSHCQKLGEDPARKERISMRLKPVFWSTVRWNFKRSSRTRPRPRSTSTYFYFGESSHEVIKKERADGKIISRWGNEMHTRQWSFQTDHQWTRQSWRVRDTLNSRIKLISTLPQIYLFGTRPLQLLTFTCLYRSRPSHRRANPA